MNEKNTHSENTKDLIQTQPLSSGRLLSRIFNKIFHIPLLVLKKATSSYASERISNDEQIIQSAKGVQKSIDELSSSERSHAEAILLKLDEKVYEFMKQNDSLKSELMAEINKDGGLSNVTNADSKKQIEKIINDSKVKSCKKLNVGSGSHILDDYINVDHREIKGVDIVGDISEIPVLENTIEEILASHVVEHFTEKQIMPILQHWYKLLRQGGKLRIIVPDIESMSIGFTRGEVSWDQLRTVTLGGQDYGSDYHLNTFSTDYIKKLIHKTLPESKFKLIASARRNGECLELEVEITKPR